MNADRWAMRQALLAIARSGDCHYYDSETQPNPCDCPPCVARGALERADGGWRFEGALHERLLIPEANPREVRLVDQWKLMASKPTGTANILSQVLRMDDEEPSERDWYRGHLDHSVAGDQCRHDHPVGRWVPVPALG